MKKKKARNTKIFKELKTRVRKEDHAELERMLQMVLDHLAGKGRLERGFADSRELRSAFIWTDTPQGLSYWRDLYDRLVLADPGYPELQ